MKGKILEQIDNYEYLVRRYKKAKDDIGVARAEGVIQGLRMALGFMPKGGE